MSAEQGKGVVQLKVQPAQRAVTLGQYIIENRATVRTTAKKFGISKSTVHKDVSERLKSENPALYEQMSKQAGTSHKRRNGYQTKIRKDCRK